MQAPPPVVQQALVGHVVDQGVAEAVHQIGEERALVEEAAGLELLEAAPHLLGRHVGDGLEQSHRHLVADHRGGLEQPLVLVAEPVDAGGDGGPHGGRHLEGQRGAREAVGPGLALERAGLDQARHALLEKERVAARALGHEPLERGERGIDAEQAVQQIRGRRGLERLQPDLGEARARAPGVRVLGSIGAGDQDMGRQGLDDGAHGRQGLRVHPLHVLEDHDEGLAPALPRHQAVDRAHDVAAPDGGIHGGEATAVLRRAQHPQDGGHALLELRGRDRAGGLPPCRGRSPGRRRSPPRSSGGAAPPRGGSRRPARTRRRGPRSRGSPGPGSGGRTRGRAATCRRPPRRRWRRPGRGRPASPRARRRAGRSRSLVPGAASAGAPGEPASRRERIGTAPLISWTSTGACSPRTGTGPSGRAATRPRTSAIVSSVARMVPGLAICSIRAARCTVCPTAVYVKDRSWPMERATTSPELRPIRTSSGKPSERCTSSP